MNASSRLSTAGGPEGTIMLDYKDIIFLIVFSLLALSCIITNCLIFYVTITRTTIGGVFKYYICSLAITDILIGFVSIPGYIIPRVIYIEATNVVYDIFIVTDMLLGVCSMWHISLMAFDRVMAISKPIFHRIHMRTKNAALKLVIIPWILAALITAVNLSVPKSFASRYGYITTSITGIAVPFLFTVVCYIFVFIAIRKRNERSSRIASNPNIVNEKRILKMILCVLAVYMFCWLPFGIVNGISSQLDSLLEDHKIIRAAAMLLHYMNSICNPFVYAIFYPSYRRGVRDVVKICFCRKDNSVACGVRQSQEMEVATL